MVTASCVLSSRKLQKQQFQSYSTFVPQDPHATVFYELVKDHSAEFLRYASEMYDKPLPRHVEKEVERYLGCSDFARGFVHVKCSSCAHDVLVPFSWKRRALCPSCAGRRMSAQAAHLVDAVVPAVAVRQYVLSFPFELSLLAATNPHVRRAVARIHYEVIAQHYRRSATESGLVGKTYPGAVTFVHRFGSSLNLRMHLRMCVLDGVFVECENEAPRFVPARSLSKEELHKIVERVAGRVVKWLRKHGYVGQEDDPGSNETRALTFDEMLAKTASH